MEEYAHVDVDHPGCRGVHCRYRTWYATSFPQTYLIQAEYFHSRALWEEMMTREEAKAELSCCVD